MDIYFSHYQLTPRRKANQLTDMSTKNGVLLKTNFLHHEIADYFPHESLGDQSVQDFLATFPQKENRYHQSILRQLQTHKSALYETPFMNHQLWIKGSKVEAEVVKYKITDVNQELPSEILNSRCTIRLDANGIFKGRDIFSFLARLTINDISRIEYIEDPSFDLNWGVIPVPAARDFIQGDPYQTVIYKPNREYLPEIHQNTIFSGYMGHPLGSLHSYRELIRRGNLRAFHGLLTPDLYQEDLALFDGNYLVGFKPNKKKIQEATSNVLDQNWIRLCSL